jgi:hypothetical protein
MRGEKEVDPVLPKFLVQALALDFNEQIALALAFTFGQKPMSSQQLAFQSMHPR